ncbi:MAG: putative signal transducing protein, partial [Rhodospirillaceae bacterium]
MKELARIDDPVFLTYLLAQLSDAGIEAEVLDQYTMAALGVGVRARAAEHSKDQLSITPWDVHLPPDPKSEEML